LQLYGSGYWPIHLGGLVNTPPLNVNRQWKISATQQPPGPLAIFIAVNQPNNQLFRLVAGRGL